MTKAVVKQENSLPALMGEIEALAGAGLEETSSEDFAIPFIQIVQSNSSERLLDAEGSKAGVFIDTTTEEVFSGDGMEVIPCMYQRQFVEWIPFDAGGGFVASHDIDSPVIKTAVRSGNKDFLPNGNELQNTAQFYCLVRYADGIYRPALISLKGSQLKNSRKWLTTIQGQRMTNTKGDSFLPPMFAYSYVLRTVAQSNKSGRWFGFAIDKPKSVDDVKLFTQAKEFHESVKSGQVKAKEGDTKDRPEEGFSSAEAHPEIPF